MVGVRRLSRLDSAFEKVEDEKATEGKGVRDSLVIVMGRQNWESSDVNFVNALCRSVEAV